ncbi:molybdopterin-dependent oxidoreductase [Roseateles chitosanitabidus]|uniref:molybdopterin-dependent oxidoreductase n=1 Tax=Roseateles chitosanitabidus TaxID=65048 RepID=UPI002357434C|nr:molybdopterin-dependent oxidoreductase [Roseateles chitosanitabidus]
MFNRSPTRRLAMAAMTVMAMGLSGTLALPALAAGPVTEKLLVEGAVRAPLMLTVDDLRAFHAEQIGTFTMTKQIDGREQSTTVRGVRLSAVLERAGVVTQDKHAWKSMAVLVTASDGYKVAFSWPELTNTEVGAGVLVVFERDGQALDDGEGRIALLSGRDLRAGPRHVKWLSRIEIRPL